MGFGVAVVVGEGVGVAVCVGVAVTVGVGVAVTVDLALATEDRAADAGPAAMGSSSSPAAIKAAPASAHSRAAIDSRLDRELKVFLASGVSGDRGEARVLWS